jgi:hypothetical protein
MATATTTTTTSAKDGSTLELPEPVVVVGKEVLDVV